MTRRKAESRRAALAIVIWASATPAVVQAQEVSGSGGGFTVRPRISMQQSWTDNLRLDSQAKDAALITTLAPGLNIVSNVGAVRGSLDYSLNGITYLKSDQPSRLQNALDLVARAELINRTFFLDVRAGIGQQNASAFGVQSAPTLGSQGSVASPVNDNQHETGTLSITPSLRGVIGGAATYELRGEYMRSETRGTALGDSQSRGASLRVDERNAGVVGWWLQADMRRGKSVLTQSNDNDTVRAGFHYRPDPDWSLSVNAGRERHDYQSSEAQQGFTGGVSAAWTPTPRTRIGADWQHHDYGDSHSFTLEHRMALSVWRLSDTVATSLGSRGSVGARSNYDAFFQLFASVEPDPVKRDALVRSELQFRGLSPDGLTAGGFLSSGPSHVRSQNLGVTLRGVRSTLSALLSRTLTSRLGDNLNQGDLANTSRIEQRMFSLTASYSLSPSSNLLLTALRQENYGDQSSQKAELTSLLASWNFRLGLRLLGQLGARHSRFEGVTPYTENSAYANLTQQF